MEKTFIGFRHLESCNNLKDQKGGTGLDKDLDPGASMWGVLQGLCISSQNEGLLDQGEKMSVDVHVSCLVRTWMTAILIYLPLTGVLHLKISPFLKETDQGENARDTLDKGYKIIGINTGLKRLDLGNMPENRFAQLRKIKRFLKTLFQMGEVLDDKITSNQWICNKINAMKGKKIVIELLGDKSYQPITIDTIDTNDIIVSLVPAIETANKPGAKITKIIRPVPVEKTALNPVVLALDPVVLALDYPPLDTDNDAKYTENFKNYVIHIAKLFNQQICEPATSSVIKMDGYNQPFVGGDSNCSLPLKKAVITPVNITNQKMKIESAGDFEPAYAYFTENTGEIEKNFWKYSNDIGDYNKSHFKSDVGAFIEFAAKNAAENAAKKIHFVAHNDILKTYVKKMFLPAGEADVEQVTMVQEGGDAFSTLFKTSSSGENKQNIWNLILKTEMVTIEESGTRSVTQINITKVTIKSGIEKMKDSKMQTISACENLCTFDTLSNVGNVFSKIGTRYSTSLGNRKPDRIQKCTTEQVAKKIAKNETTTAKGWLRWTGGGKKRTRRLTSKGKRHKSRRRYTKK
jgi:hypothetical protein